MAYFKLSESELLFFANFAYRQGTTFYFRKIQPKGEEIFYADPNELREAWAALGRDDEERRARLVIGGGLA